MDEIVKEATIVLTQNEIDSPQPIKIVLRVQDEEGEEITYTITYPKN